MSSVTDGMKDQPINGAATAHFEQAAGPQVIVRNLSGQWSAKWATLQGDGVREGEFVLGAYR